MANKPAPVTDAEAEEWQNWAEEDVDGVEGSDGVEGNHDEMFLRLLADRTRDKERIRKLERRLRHIRSWAADTDRALLEVPDGE